MLAEIRERLALPSRVEGERVPVSNIGMGPSLGTIIPGSFQQPGEATPAKPWPPFGAEAPLPNKVIAAGRLSWDTQYLFGAGMPVILPPDQNMEEWRRLDLDADRIKWLPAAKLLEILTDNSPDVSRALWDFLRLCNPGWKCTVYKAGTRTPSAQGQALVDQWTRTVGKRYGSMDVPIGRMHFGAFLRGAIMSELVFDADAKTPIDLATPDPNTARFRQQIDPVLGRVWSLGQFQLGQWVDLSVRETISYIPIDPAPANPYGRPPCGPAIFSALFMIGVLTDLRRVVAQQGYPRYDLSVSLEALRKSTPPNIFQDPAAWKQWVDNTISEVQKAYNALEPDSALVHTDVVTVNRPTGAVSADALAGIDPLIRALERQTARALKTTPLLMGIIEGQSEANANRQWELHAAGIQAIQNLSQADLSEKCTLICEANGIAAEAEWVFDEFRAAEAYRDAMTQGLVIDNATKLYLMGVISEEVMADMTTGEPPDQPEPRFLPTTEQPYYEAATTTNSPRADGQPANTPGQGQEPSDKKPQGAPKTDISKDGDAQDPNSRKMPSPVEWPIHHVNGHSRANGEPFHPSGLPLAYTPHEVAYDEGDRRRLLREWDSAVPEAAGLLTAQVEFHEPPDGEPVRFDTSAAALRDAAVALQETMAELRKPVEPTLPRTTRKVVERDEEGRIKSVIEVAEDAATA